MSTNNWQSIAILFLSLSSALTTYSLRVIVKRLEEIDQSTIRSL